MQISLYFSEAAFALFFLTFFNRCKSYFRISILIRFYIRLELHAAGLPWIARVVRWPLLRPAVVCASVVVLYTVIPIAMAVNWLATVSSLKIMHVWVSHIWIPHIGISLSSRGCIPFVRQEQLALDISNVGILVLQIIDGLTLLLYILLIVICLISDRLKELLDVLHRECTGLMVFNCLSAINPVSSCLSLFHLSLPRFAQVQLVSHQNDWNH